MERTTHHASPLTGSEDAEHIVVTRGGGVVVDAGVLVGTGAAAGGDIDAAALALAVAESGGAGPAVRLVAGDRAFLEGEDRCLVGENAAAQAVAAVASAAVAALGHVVGDDAIDHGGADRPGVDEDEAPRVGDTAATAHPAGGACATHRLVVGEDTVAEGQ